jgi:hypothetical protein
LAKPFTRDTAREHALGHTIRRNGAYEEATGEESPTIKIFGITDEGVFLGELEGWPFITYEWLAKNCVFGDTGEPCGMKESTDG